MKALFTPHTLQGPWGSVGHANDLTRAQPPQHDLPKSRNIIGTDVTRVARCHGLTAPRPAFVTRNAQAHDCFDVSELTRTQAATARQRARQLGAGSACGGSEI